ncbi:hypothetical protein L798_02127 [Zootermopsis nevadensis]|uniref:Uncharacterized protein n=1 Tax=Zootermopsis nevadensis TaxID=136037 RepID=A0A067RIW1_ZOONE|nr:hypothetical protein L798_02127 [Zootermopsis nevadensis]
MPNAGVTASSHISAARTVRKRYFFYARFPLLNFVSDFCKLRCLANNLRLYFKYLTAKYFSGRGLRRKTSTCAFVECVLKIDSLNLQIGCVTRGGSVAIEERLLEGES